MSKAFARELLAAARPFSLEANPFLVRLQRGEVDRKTLGAYAVGLAAMAQEFPRVLAAVLALCNEPAIREALLGNLLDEEGAVAFSPRRGVTLDPERHHGALARRFARAAGASPAEIAAARVEEPRWFTAALRSGDWMGPLAYFAVGFEANVPATFRLLIASLLERYGFTRDDLEYLSEHVTADERHGAEMASLIASTAGAPGPRQRALEGARRGGLAWWQYHRRFARPGSA